MNIENHAEKRNVTIVTFDNEQLLDDAKIETMAEDIRKALTQESHQMIINFANVQFMSSLVLAKLLKLHRIASDGGGKLVLCEITKDVLQVFKITRMDKVMTITPNMKEALKLF